MRFLITGATGFIGRSVVRHTLNAGHEVTAPVRSMTKASAALPVDHPLLTVEECESLSTFESSRNHDALIHLAWEDVGAHTNPKNLLQNTNDQFLFLTRLIDSGVKNLTVAGTCLEYGLTEGCLAEDGRLNPVSFYGLAKTTLSRMLSIHCQTAPGVDLKWLRYFYVYGPHQRPQSLLRQLMASIENGDEAFNMSPGDQLRDFIHVETLAHNTLMVAQQNVITGPINIGNGKPTKVLDFVEELIRLSKARISLNKGHYPYHPYEPFAFWANTEKMSLIPGVRFDEGAVL